ncbi:class I SAM-dependent methyltransferase [Pontibacter populi]|uniref:Methyltransferase domain-containing protein n=1 Tax=Pontibacter populi TaxID=890055 RepID=A0ABV1RSH1_9BACT
MEKGQKREMEKVRKPLQGVTNIIRFNWHFYVIALALILLLLFVAGFLDNALQTYIYIVCSLVLGAMVISLLVSMYVYDFSGLYKLQWVEQENTENVVVNINAGFDETSALLNAKFKRSELIVMDFYDPAKHTEVSIKRARKAFPPFPNTKHTRTDHIQLTDNSVDKIFLTLSAHEIRDEDERAAFFREINRILKPTGQIYITEHLRDLANFLAYNIGFFHFHSKRSWLKTFEKAELNAGREIKLTPFISSFILTKNGNTL